MLHNDFDFQITDINFVVKRQTTPSWKISYANREHHIVALCTGGQAAYETNGDAYTVGKGDVLFFPKQLFHSGISNPDDPFSYYIAQFDAMFASQASEEQFYKLSNIIGSALYPQFVTLFEELYTAWSVKKNGHMLKCKSRIMDIFYLLVRESDLISKHATYSPKIEKVVHFIAEHYRSNYSVEELSRLADLSPSQFRSLFKQVTGLTVTEYQIRMKLDKARDLLLSSTCNVTEAAHETGFTDIYYFSRLFKKKTGMSPTAYVKAYRLLN